MINAVQAIDPGRAGTRRLLGIFAAPRLRAYACGIAVIYAVVLVHFYRGGGWIVDSAGAPLYTDFSDTWVVGIAALRGEAAQLYNSAEFVRMQASLLGPMKFYYPNWPYPPTVFLVLAPFALLPYLYAFIAWGLMTLFGCISAVFFIVRRSAAVALVLASPYTAWNLLAGQNGFLTASLLGASLLFLERRPVLAGVFIGCLTYKPQFGILFPVALAAAREWRAFASATATVTLLVAISSAWFGSEVWAAFPRALIAHFGINLVADPGGDWGLLQTVYGLARVFQGSIAVAVFAQAATTLCAAIVVWLVWRSPVRYALKAAMLSAAALLATPHAFAYDLAAIAIPVAFLAKDQLGWGLLKGEQTTLLALFGITLAALVTLGDSPHRTTFGSVPLGPVVLIALLGIILRRTLRNTRQPAELAATHEQWAR
jgi:hypothetical protein